MRPKNGIAKIAAGTISIKALNIAVNERCNYFTKFDWSNNKFPKFSLNSQETSYCSLHLI